MAEMLNMRVIDPYPAGSRPQWAERKMNQWPYFGSTFQKQSKLTEDCMNQSLRAVSMWNLTTRYI